MQHRHPRPHPRLRNLQPLRINHQHQLLIRRIQPPKNHNFNLLRSNLNRRLNRRRIHNLIRMPNNNLRKPQRRHRKPHQHHPVANTMVTTRAGPRPKQPKFSEHINRVSPRGRHLQKTHCKTNKKNKPHHAATSFGRANWANPRHPPKLTRTCTSKTIKYNNISPTAKITVASNPTKFVKLNDPSNP